MAYIKLAQELLVQNRLKANYVLYFNFDIHEHADEVVFIHLSKLLIYDKYLEEVEEKSIYNVYVPIFNEEVEIDQENKHFENFVEVSPKPKTNLLFFEKY